MSLGMEVEEPLSGDFVMEVENLNGNGVSHEIENGQNEILKCSADILIRIGSCLDTNDLFNLSLTCRFMNSFVRRELDLRRRALFNGQRKLKAELMPPMGRQGRYGHCCIYHAPQNRVYVCGGRTDQGAILNDTSYFDLETQKWEKGIYADTTRFMPSKCLFASLCSYKDNLILFGGYHFDSTPATGLCKVFTLNLTQKRWSVTFCKANIKNLHGHSAIMHYEDACMLTFGGHRIDGDSGGNEMYLYDCKSSDMSAVVQLNDRPSPRVFPALAFANPNNLVVVGGRTSIEEAYEILHDAYLFTFTNPQKTEGYWTRVEIEGVNLWPTCTPTFAQAGNILYMVSQPMDTTHVLVDNSLICQLYNSGEAEEQLKKPEIRKLCCNDALMACRRHDSNFGILSGRYLQDSSLLDPENRLTRSIASFPELNSEGSQNSLINDCRNAIAEFYARKQVFFNKDDLQCVLMWLNSARHSRECLKYKIGQYRSCSGVCFKPKGCIYEVLKKYFQSNGEAFLNQMCAILYNFTGYSQPDFAAVDFPPLEECRFWSGEQQGNVIPMTEFLKMQSLLPVHRVFFDAPLTTTIYKLDLKHVVEQHKIRLKQDPVRFMAPLFNKYSAMTFTENGFLLCGGVSGEWSNLFVINFPNNPRRPSTETIFIS
ncbi:F-box only protein 42 [Aphelenchoides bicaudatus]|nr:F-box only protein 42 [Aphelenchoides bicaudatus]